MSKFLNWLIYLFLFLTPWQAKFILRPGFLNGQSWEFGIVGIYGLEILLWLIILVYLWEKKFKISLSARYWWVVSFLAFLFLRAYFSFDKMLGWQQIWHLGELAVLTAIIYNRKMLMPNLLLALIGGLGLSAVLGLWQFFSQETFASRYLGLTLHQAWLGGTSVLEGGGGRWLRAYGSLPHPNIFGGYMLLGVALILYFFKDIQNKSYRLFLSAFLLVLTAGLFVSFSRSAWLGWVIVLILFVWQERKNFWRKQITLITILSLVLFFVLIGLFSEIFSNRVQASGYLEQQSQTERISGYKEAVNLLPKYLWWGTGSGNYSLAVFKNNPTKPVWQYEPTHNVFLLVFLELGLIGTFCLILFLRSYKKYFLFFLPFLPILFLDHYLWSLWSGLAIVFVMIIFGQFSKQKELERS